jgi:Delta3-Delta2-enoyl-CoA isomerase
MKTVKLTFKDHHAVIELQRPPAHAINFDMVNDLRAALSDLSESTSVKGAILTGSGRIFCAGLDVVELYTYDEERMNRFWRHFLKLLHDLIALPLPLVGAINGHAPAGGAVFALCCDHCVMADTDTRIGLNEVNVGIVIPPPIIELARFALGDGPALQLALDGALLPPAEAKARGYVHEVVPADELLAAAERKLEAWIAAPQVPWRETKRMIKAPLLDAMLQDPEAALTPTLRHWWSGESRARLQKFIDNLKKK